MLSLLMLSLLSDLSSIRALDAFTRKKNSSPTRSRRTATIPSPPPAASHDVVEAPAASRGAVEAPPAAARTAIPAASCGTVETPAAPPTQLPAAPSKFQQCPRRRRSSSSAPGRRKAPGPPPLPAVPSRSVPSKPSQPLPLPACQQRSPRNGPFSLPLPQLHLQSV